MSRFIEKYELAQRARADRLPKYKTALCKLLHAAGAVKVMIEYDSEGDSGQIDDVTMYDARGAHLADKPLSASAQRTFSKLHLFKNTLCGALESFAWELLASHHAGFEDNEGAFGTITLNVAKQTAEIEHNARIIDVLTTTKEV